MPLLAAVATSGLPCVENVNDKGACDLADDTSFLQVEGNGQLNTKDALRQHEHIHAGLERPLPNLGHTEVMAARSIAQRRDRSYVQIGGYRVRTRLTTAEIVLIVLAVFFVVCCGIPCCLLCCVATALVGAADMAMADIQNEVVKQMRVKYDKECPPEEKAKYGTPKRRAESDAMFDKADVDKNGSLDLQELETTIQKLLLESDCSFASAFMKAFDDNKDSSISKDEFFEMVKCIEFFKDQEKQSRAS